MFSDYSTIRILFTILGGIVVLVGISSAVMSVWRLVRPYFYSNGEDPRVEVDSDGILLALSSSADLMDQMAKVELRKLEVLKNILRLQRRQYRAARRLEMTTNRLERRLGQSQGTQVRNPALSGN
ncbi:MAG: hypothetical protein M1812_005267 [Candelaria pacifica]|nr:MAG: hypothetical protein M1812_005267 [Candelaria pacifica]